MNVKLLKTFQIFQMIIIGTLDYHLSLTVYFSIIHRILNKILFLLLLEVL